MPLICAVAALAVWATGALQPVEDALTEMRFSLLGRPASGEVVVLAIDPASLEALDFWPWPRGLHATVTENLLAAGARTVAFDLDFSSRSNPGEDRDLAAAFTRAGTQVILPAFVQWDGAPGAASRRVASLPLPEFRRGTRLASINIVPEGDGRTRRYRRQFVIQGRTLPSLAVAMADDAPAEGEPFTVDFGIQAGDIPRLSYIDVLTGTFAAEQVRDRVVLIGATSVELGDQVSVPAYNVLPGVLLQALAFESLVQDRDLTPAGAGAVAGAVLAVTALFGAGISGRRWRPSLAVLCLAVLLVLAASVAVQRWLPLVLHVAPALLTLVLIFTAGLLRRLDHQGLRLLWQRRQLRRKDLIIEQVMSSSFDAIFTLGPDDRVASASTAACRLFRLTSAQIAGKPMDDLIQRERTPEAGERVLGRRGDGSSFPAEVVRNEMRLRRGEAHVVMVRDISQREAHQQALQYRATHDPLTDLPNRLLLQERMQEALTNCRRLAVFILDLNRFKEVNDTLGHHAGDGLLRDVARRLQEVVPAGATLARIGGDEFALLLPDADVPTAREAAGRIQSAVALPFAVARLSLDVGVSVGIALYPEHGNDAAELLQRADVAMYLAKRRRQDTTVYDPEEDRHSVRHLTLVGDLKHAIQTGGLSLAFQPQISSATGQTVAMEALVRWHHPEHGPLPPEDFVRMAENTGLIQSLSLWVLRAALGQARHWRDRGWRLPVAVNLSVHDLKDGKLPQALAGLLNEWDLPPELLTLELTEGVLMESPERTLGVMEALARLGVRISIDDFGTGYSSLSYLKRLPAREVKIDRTFVHDMDRDPDDLVIVRSIIDLAHNLGLEVVAEGVERPALWRRLVELGCDLGQGHHFSPPMSADRFTSLPRSQVHAGRLAEAAARRSDPLA